VLNGPTKYALQEKKVRMGEKQESMHMRKKYLKNQQENIPLLQHDK
jgi:hypothetical protein